MITLLDIDFALKTYTNRQDFDSWIIANEKELSNFFYKQSGNDLFALKFDNFFFENISASAVYQDYHKTLRQTEPFLIFLNLIANAAEKLAEIGISSFAETVVIDLPDSPSKYRLMALNDFALVDDIRTSYFSKFPSVLDKLDKSRLLFEEGNIRQIVDVLGYYYKKAKNALESRGLTDKVLEIKALFKSEPLIKQYPFLTHQILTDLINDVNPFDLYPSEILRERLEPSPSIRNLFSKLNSDYFNHPNINSEKDDLWGLSRKEILDDVLIRGRGDFTKSYGKISAEDKVMLYCYFNLKKHFFTSYAVFQTVVSSLENLFATNEYKPVFIDLGCGPMTSGLALADLIHSKTGKGINFSYIGVDISNPMMKKAESFKSLNIFSSDSTFTFVNNWNEIAPSMLNQLAGKNNPIMFNASYLFASSSVDALDLGKYVTEISNNFANVFFVFQNPNRIDRNIKYEEFKKSIKFESLINKNENIRYKPASVESNEDVSYEILKL
jgi:hypothetical protein